LLAYILRRQPHGLKRRFAERIAEIIYAGNQFSFISNQSSCVFIEKAIEHYTPGAARDLTIEEEESCIKAYLLATQEWVDEDIFVFKGIKSFKDPKHIVEFALPHFLTFEDLKRFRDFRWQIFKAIEFFSFVEQHEVLKYYLKPFLDQYSSPTWQEYIYKILNCFLSLYRPEEGSGAILKTKLDDTINDFLDPLSIIDPSIYSKKIDFIGLREKPIYKSNSNSYIFYNYSFFIDKLFQTIVFDYGTILKNSGVVKDVPDFKSKYYSEPFYEQFFLYKLIRYMIGKRKRCSAIDGLEWERLEGEKGPDFYIRCGSKIFIIELKDTIFQAKAKVSRDYNTIKTELFTKLKANKKGKQKGITQLAILSDKIAEIGLDFDKFDKGKVQIYPILLITDEAYNSYGINYVLNSEYQSILGVSAKSISKDLLVIHIDTLIEIQDLIHDRKVPIQDCFQWYFNYTNSLANPHNRFLSFSHFIIKELELKNKKVEVLSRNLINQLHRLIEFE